VPADGRERGGETPLDIAIVRDGDEVGGVERDDHAVLAHEDDLPIMSNDVAWADLCRRVEAEGQTLDAKASGGEQGQGRNRALVREKVPWYEVVPLSWVLGMGLRIAAAIGAGAWFILFLVRHHGS
jgi:hypothetical protein